MRTLVLAIGLVLGLAIASPASAADWTMENMGTKLGTGLNGIVTSPADIIMGAMEGSSLTKIQGLTNLAGLVVGTGEAAARIVSGGTDALLFLLPEVGMISPKARYAVIPGTKM
jgi:hypothetical protein